MPTPKPNGHKPRNDKSPPALAPLEPAQALSAIQREIDALPADEVLTIRVDIPRAVSTALGAAPAIKALRPHIVEELPRFPLATLDGLETYALAALYAHLSTTSEVGDDAVRVLLDEATPLRETLLVAAEPLAHRGLMDAARLSEIKSGHGHIDMANDLVGLGAMYSAAWSTIANKTPVARDEVDRATVLGTALLAALGQREQGGVAAAKTVRARAFTLFVRAYETVQRAVTYLRWNEDDAAQIAPSIFKPWRRAGKKGGVVEDGAAADTAPEPAEAPATPPTPVDEGSPAARPPNGAPKAPIT